MLGPFDVAAVMSSVVAWWGIAGGWAIDLWLGGGVRDHHDVEVVVRRSDHAIVDAALRDAWDLRCIDPPGTGWRAWEGGPIEWPAFQIQAASERGVFDLFLENVDDDVWAYRRDPTIVRPASDVIATLANGTRVVRPDVQLLYMAASTEPKNERDFRAALPRLSPSERTWLARSLDIARPGHRWAAELALT